MRRTRRAAPLLLFGALLAAACSQPEPGSDFDVEQAPACGPRVSGPAPASKLTLEEVARYPLPGTNVPSAISIRPGGELLTTLWSPGGSLERELFMLDLRSDERRTIFVPPEGGATEENLSQEEKLQRERRRERGLGVTSYAWARDADRFVVPLRGELWVQDGVDAQARKVVRSQGAPALDVQITRAGDRLAYVMDDEIYVVDAAGGAPRQITSGARGTGRTHGLAEYIAQEEMGRHEGLWWSDDGSAIAFTEVDETHIPVYRIEHQGRSLPSHEDHRYPFAGAANAKVRLFVVSAEGGTPKQMDIGMEGEAAVYLARVHWMPDGRLLAEIENRAQTRLDLVQLDPRSGTRELLHSETSEVWINLHHAFRALETESGPLAGGFVWASEASGYRHLAVHGLDGQLLHTLTSGDWMVDDLVGVDEDEGRVYFTATRDGVTQEQLYRVPLSGGEIERLTREPGSHRISMDRDRRWFVDHWSDLSTPPRITLHDAETGEKLHDVYTERDPRIDELELLPPRLAELPSRDGVTLHAAIYEPAGPRPHPVLVSVYGGPEAQSVTDSWDETIDLRAQYYRDRGFLVFKLDNRGSARRGLAFEGALRHDMGHIEVQDQVDGVRWLVEQGLADPERVGIYGWSYGGYLAAMALAKAPDTFRAAVAGAPVSSWDGYDTHYTERYMGTPQNDAEGYRSSSVLEHVGAIRGRLLLVHGLIDENVHFRHTARLVDALIAARKDYELLLFPNERHMPRAERDRVYMERRIADFFERALCGPRGTRLREVEEAIRESPVIRGLLDRGVDPNLPHRGVLPLTLARGNPALAERLELAGAQPGTTSTWEVRSEGPPPSK
jgi:dipeptidyl-peptidase-4